ncbi:hypothetical protein A2U01_0101010, partial [Trifolium medium]|nr:hypothetical protein [Trifolium medium]
EQESLARAREEGELVGEKSKGKA